MEDTTDAREMPFTLTWKERGNPREAHFAEQEQLQAKMLELLFLSAQNDVQDITVKA